MGRDAECRDETWNVGMRPGKVLAAVGGTNLRHVLTRRSSTSTRNLR